MIDAEDRLLIAVLKQALIDLDPRHDERGAPLVFEAANAIAAQAAAWFDAPDHGHGHPTYAYTFPGLCRALGLSPAGVRAGAFGPERPDIIRGLQRILESARHGDENE